MRRSRCTRMVSLRYAHVNVELSCPLLQNPCHSECTDYVFLRCVVVRDACNTALGRRFSSIYCTATLVYWSHELHYVPANNAPAWTFYRTPGTHSQCLQCELADAASRVLRRWNVWNTNCRQKRWYQNDVLEHVHSDDLCCQMSLSKRHIAMLWRHSYYPKEASIRPCAIADDSLDKSSEKAIYHRQNTCMLFHQHERLCDAFSNVLLY